MNGKVRRFYEELAAMSGLRLDPEGGALYGTYKGYGVAVLAPNPSYPYQMCAVFSASRPDGPLTKEECKQFLKEHKAAADLSQNGWQITMVIRGGMGQKHLRENFVQSLEDTTAYLRGAGFTDCCQSCGKVTETDPCCVAGAYEHLCPDCYAALQQSRNQESMRQAGKGENITGGLVGALLGSLVGVVSIIIFSQLGYVAALSGVIMAVCTLKGYEMLGGNLSRKGVALCVVLMLAMTFVGDRLDWAILVSRELGYSFLTSFRLIPALIEADIIEASSYWTNLVMLYLFLLLGMIPTVRNSLVSRANASRIYRLEKSGTRM